MRDKRSSLFKGIVILAISLTCLCKESAAFRPPKDGPPQASIQFFQNIDKGSSIALTYPAGLAVPKTPFMSCPQAIYMLSGTARLFENPTNYFVGEATIESLTPPKGSNSCPKQFFALVTWTTLKGEKLRFTGALATTSTSFAPDKLYHFNGELFEVESKTIPPRSVRISNLLVAVDAGSSGDRGRAGGGSGPGF